VIVFVLVEGRVRLARSFILRGSTCKIKGGCATPDSRWTNKLHSYLYNSWFSAPLEIAIVFLPRLRSGLLNAFVKLWPRSTSAFPDPTSIMEEEIQTKDCYWMYNLQNPPHKV
jgi:hypothetical protein